MDENGFTKSQLENLYWYYSQFENADDTVGAIIEIYKRSGSVAKTRLSVKKICFIIKIPISNNIKMNRFSLGRWNPDNSIVSKRRFYGGRHNFQLPIKMKHISDITKISQQCIHSIFESNYGKINDSECLFSGHPSSAFARNHHFGSIHVAHVHEISGNYNSRFFSNFLIF